MSILHNLRIRKKNINLSPEEAQTVATVQTMNDIAFKQDLKNILDASDETDRAMGLLGFRASLQQKVMSGELEEEDFNRYMQETIIPLADLATEEALSGGWFSRDTAMNGVVNRLEDLLDAVSSYEKAYIYQMAYDEINNAGLVDAMESGNDLTLDTMALRIKANFEKKKYSGSIGQDVAKILVNGTVQDFSDKNTPISNNQDYKIFERSNGVRYKVYKDENGNFSEKSRTERIF